MKKCKELFAEYNIILILILIHMEEYRREGIIRRIVLETLV